jgi:hypothetical protein
MNPQDLQIAWNDLQASVETNIRRQIVSTEQDQQSTLGRFKNRLVLAPAAEIILALLCLLFAGNFIADEWTQIARSPGLGLPALSLYVFAIPMIYLSVRQIVAVSQVELQSPVLLAQAGLGQYRHYRALATMWIFAVGTAFWFVPFVLMLQMAAGADVLSRFDAGWLVGNVVFAVLVVPVLLWIFRRSRWAGRLVEGLSGKAVKDASQFLTEVQNFRDSC